MLKIAIDGVGVCGPGLEDWTAAAAVLREERRYAFACLGGYPRAARQPIVEQGLKSRDAEIRATCERLSRLGSQLAPARGESSDD